MMQALAQYSSCDSILRLPNRINQAVPRSIGIRTALPAGWFRVRTNIARQPLLEAIALEVCKTNGGTAADHVPAAKHMLEEAFRSLERAYAASDEHTQ
jgi:hypothetical protein